MAAGLSHAAVSFLEDFENETPLSGTLDDHLGYTKCGPCGSVGYQLGDPTRLSSTVVVIPGSNTNINKEVPGLAEDLIQFSFDMFTTGLYDGGGEVTNEERPIELRLRL